MKKNEPLKVALYINGKQVDTLTEEQREIVAKRIGEALSQYYSLHPEEYAKL